ncbi:hypothetical protein GWK91_05675 [Virgibacillus sp. MSP4-1]|uniref:hypothetical protein n=1 Tax=Virgibacillus sp. MSP4-1 TaxID=2700081 RepID=UPI0003A0CAF1|nr:hypothetical protein [Virgibacillus sp. MSP4-1]QHS22471.1 hypothetical protein GWK91_05675 [Virgibacillus sp. MSP4-1]
MSAPGLRKLASHSAIHEAAIIEAQELTELLGYLLEKGDWEKAEEIAFVTLEHWETRTLQHAASEEEGLYKEMAEESSELRDSVIALTRDHDLLRILVREIKDLLNKDGVGKNVLDRFQALILIDQLHNDEEEKVLPEH